MGNDLIEDHLDYLSAEGMSPNTIRDRARCLRALNQDMPHGWAFAIREQLTAWLAYQKWSPATRHTYHGHLAGAYAWLHQAGHRPDNPMSGIKAPRVPRQQQPAATDEQLAVALTAPEPLLTAVILAAYGGLRRFEITGLHREHVTEETITILVAKGGDTETVPCHPAIWEHIRNRPGGPLVDLTPEQLSGRALKWFRRRGLHAFGLHHFRRRYGKLIQREHGDIRVTQECLRHKSVTTTANHYTEVDESQRRAVVRALKWIGHLPDANRQVPPAQPA